MPAMRRIAGKRLSGNFFGQPLFNRRCHVLSDQIQRDYNLALPLAGGDGRTRDCPVVLTCSDPFQASVVEETIMFCLNDARQCFWRPLAKEQLTDAGRTVEVYRYEAKFVEGDQFVTERSLFYFDISAVVTTPKQTPPAYFRLAETPFILPSSVGWLHFVRQVNNEEEHPGLGYAAAFTMLGAQVTVYVYDKGLSHISHSETPELFTDEFHSAVSDIRAHLQPGRENSPQFWGHAAYQSFELPGKQTALMLFTQHNHFVKVRSTVDYQAVPEAAQLLMESLTALGSLFLDGGSERGAQ